MKTKSFSEPDSTAVRVALWRALHLLVDEKPHILQDDIGLRLVAPDESWRQRPDMHPQGTSGYRAGIVARARFVEDLVEKESAHSVSQYVILGAGLDSFAQRRKDLLAKVRVFEIDKPETQAWKKHRLTELGLDIPSHLRFVPVDFEAGESWWEKLSANGFDAAKPAVVVSTGVSLYLTKEANQATLRQMKALAPGSTFVMTFILPPQMVDAAERPQFEMVMERAKAAGTPFVSLFTPEEMLAMARQAGFHNPKHISRNDIVDHFFKGRPDGLRPASGEEYLVVRT